MRAWVYYWVLGLIGHISWTLFSVGRGGMLGGGAGYHMTGEVDLGLISGIEVVAGCAYLVS